MLDRTELKELRRRLGMTQKDLAKKAEITVLTVVNFEKGCPVRPKSEYAIRQALRVEWNLRKQTMV